VTDNNLPGLYYAEHYFQMSRDDKVGKKSLFSLIQAHLSSNDINVQRLGGLYFKALHLEQKHGLPGELSSEFVGRISSRLNNIPEPDLASCIGELLKVVPLHLQFAKDIGATLSSSGVTERVKRDIITHLVMEAGKNPEVGQSELEEAVAYLLKSYVQLADLPFEVATHFLSLPKCCFKLFQHQQLGFIKDFLEAKINKGSLHEVLPANWIRVLHAAWGNSFANFCKNEEETQVFLAIMDYIANATACPDKARGKGTGMPMEWVM